MQKFLLSALLLGTIFTAAHPPEWMNVYHGGTRPAATDDHLYIDNVVIAPRYIGPVD